MQHIKKLVVYSLTLHSVLFTGSTLKPQETAGETTGTATAGKNVFYRCQLTALTYSLTVYCYVFTLPGVYQDISLSETPLT